MSNRITENTIEEFAIELLERLGYQYIYAPDLPVLFHADRYCPRSACARHADRWRSKDS